MSNLGFVMIFVVLGFVAVFENRMVATSSEIMHLTRLDQLQSGFLILWMFLLCAGFFGGTVRAYQSGTLFSRLRHPGVCLGRFLSALESRCEPIRNAAGCEPDRVARKSDCTRFVRSLYVGPPYAASNRG